MHKLINILCILLLIIVLGVNIHPQSSDDSLYKLGYELHQKTKFSKKQIKSLISLLENAKKEGMTVDFLENRIREGIAKRARFKSIYKVVKEKIGFQKMAHEWTNDYIRLGMKYDNKDYCVKSLSIMIEKDFSKIDFRAIANLVLLRKLKMEDAIALSKLLLSKKSDKKVKEIIIYGLLENYKIDEIKNKVEKKSKTRKSKKISFKNLFGLLK